MYQITTENGKYKFVNDGGVVKVYNNGTLRGQDGKALLTLLQKVERYEEALKYYAYDANSLKDEGNEARKSLEE